MKKREKKEREVLVDIRKFCLRTYHSSYSYIYKYRTERIDILRTKYFLIRN